MGRPSASSALGINDPKGDPGCLRDRVERLPMRPECINVRALSANEGSGIADWPLVTPLACFPEEEEDIAEHSLGMRITLKLPSRSSGGPHSDPVVSFYRKRVRTTRSFGLSPLWGSEGAKSIRDDADRLFT